ncbi:MFS transporter [Tardiphaga sp. 619_E2_N8_5]|uniref:MFS transporter n=1 Tax=unclassified Tardiphaga TaxID=2631404 RepID=UPI003F28D185
MSAALDFASPIRHHPQIGALLGVVVLVMAGNGIVAPSLPFYAASFSVSAALVGLVVTFFGVGRLCANLPAGLLAQRWDGRLVLLSGPAILIVGCAGAALASNFVTLLVWRFVQGVGSGIYMTASTAIIAILADRGERGRVMALYQAALLFGTGSGPIIGGVVVSQFGFSAPFWLYAALCATGFVLAAATAKKGAVAVRVDAAHSHFSIALRRPALLLACYGNLNLFYTRSAAQFMAVPLVAHQRFHFELGSIGVALTVVSFCNFAVLPMVGALIDRVGAHRVSQVSLLLIAVALFGIAFGQIESVFWSSLVLLGIGGGFGASSLGVLVSEAVETDSFAMAFGLFRTAGDFGFVIGPILLGVLIDVGGGLPVGLVFNALLMVSALLGMTAGDARRLQ